jgi:hypothetical protein
MPQKYFLATTFVLLLAACTAFEDAEMTERKTFVHFYSSGVNYVGTVAELDKGGFILSGEARYENGETDALIIRTDSLGHKLWETIIPKGVVRAIKPTGDTYILLGDSVQQNPKSLQVNELINSYARITILDTDGNKLDQHITKRSLILSRDTLNVDYHGDALALDQAGNIVVLGGFREPGENEASFVSAFNPSDLSDSLWSKTFHSLDNNDLINCHALHVTPTSSLLWASKTSNQVQSVSREFISISNVDPNSSYNSYSIYGESDTRNHTVEDLQKSSIGYAAIGTSSETNGLNANMYFVLVDAAGHIMPESIRYFDGESVILNNAALTDEEKATSRSFDEGLAIVATGDGFVLAGAMTSTPTVGNGGKDILLIKVDASGKLIWTKLIGGSGDEVVSSIRQTSDRGLLLFGTNTINGLSSMMLLKTDENGNINN